MEEVFKCPACGEKTYDDDFGYSPPVPQCKNCKHCCMWDCPEGEKLGFKTKAEYEAYKRGLSERK